MRTRMDLLGGGGGGGGGGGKESCKSCHLQMTPVVVHTYLVQEEDLDLDPVGTLELYY